jgi:hypothetical protein
MSENKNTSLHPPLKLEISHVVIISLLYARSSPSAIHFHKLVNDKRALVIHYPV